ncbi:MAG: peptidylprolyl isomerase [Salibacteraceae bacterium]
MRFFIILVSVSFLFSCGKGLERRKSKKEIVEVTTNKGVIKIKLYDDTPLHKANFLALVDSGFYDSLLFHRVIKDFMIQVGDPDSKNAPKGKALGNGGPGYTIESEILPIHNHKKGVIAAARQGDDVNPEKRSSGSQFYIVTGRAFSKSNLAQMSKSIDQRKKHKHLKYILNQKGNEASFNYLKLCQQQGENQKYDSLIQTFDPILNAYLDSIGMHSFNKQQIEDYSTIGGAPHLDGGYTVFGEIIEGLAVIDNISFVVCDPRDRPIENVLILGMKRVKD